MTDDIKALRETAEAAKGINTDSFSLPTGQYKKLAAFYDLASPDRIARLLDRLEAAEKDAAKSECRAILFGDLLHQNIIAMRAAVVAGHLESHAHGLQWIVNSLYGPGHLPNIEEARALGGAQALFDKEMAAHEEFRRTHPGPEAAIDAAMQVRP